MIHDLDLPIYTQQATSRTQPPDMSTTTSQLAEPIDSSYSGSNGVHTTPATNTTNTASTTNPAGSEGHLPARNIAGDGANHSTSMHTQGTQSVIEKLQSNIQESVKEATNGERTDPNVAEDLGSRSAGKQSLEGLGLGGDERKTTLRDVRE